MVAVIRCPKAFPACRIAPGLDGVEAVSQRVGHDGVAVGTFFQGIEKFVGCRTVRARTREARSQGKCKRTELGYHRFDSHLDSLNSLDIPLTWHSSLKVECHGSLPPNTASGRNRSYEL